MFFQIKSRWEDIDFFLLFFTVGLRTSRLSKLISIENQIILLKENSTFLRGEVKQQIQLNSEVLDGKAWTSLLAKKGMEKNTIIGMWTNQT